MSKVITAHLLQLGLQVNNNRKIIFDIKLIFFFQEEPVNCDLFHRAVFFDKRNEIESFLKEGINKQNLFEIPDKLGNTALMIAVIRDHVE